MEGKRDLGETIEQLSKPIDIYVEPTHPLLMESPLTEKSKYAPLVVDPFSGSDKTEMLRVGGNELAKEVLSSGKIDISDKRVEVGKLNQGDLLLLGSGRSHL